MNPRRLRLEYPAPDPDAFPSIKAFRQLFDASPLPMWIVERATLRILDSNRAATEEYGYDRHEFQSMTLRNLTAGADVGALEAAVDEPADRRSVGTWPHRTKDGRVPSVELEVSRLDWPAGEVALLVARNTTEQQRARAEVTRLAEAVDAADLVVIATTIGGEITSWNRAAQRLFGYAPAEIVGHNLIALVAATKSRHIARLLRVAGAGGRVQHVETASVTKDGETIEIRLSVSPVRGAGGRVLGLSVVVQDIRARRSLEDQLRQAQKMEAIGRLAGGIAHDFNNLLTAIGGYAQLLRDSLEPADARYEDADEVVRATRRATELTRQLLAFSRRQVLAPTVVSVNEVVGDMQPMLDRLMGGAVSLVVGLAPDAGHVRVDRSQLEQVILNLAINGRDAMQNGGTLLIETAALELDESYATTHAEVEPGTYTLLAVSDQGAGITPEAQERLFEPFFTTKPSGKGTGLGLATVYGIVRQSGGHVFPYSEPGMGTTFRVYLPQVAPEPGAVARDVEPRREVDADGATVLVVDDERAIRELIRSILAARGFRVLIAESGADAITLARDASQPVDLLITDVAMPGLSGPDLANRMRSVQRDLPVIYISGYPEDRLPDGVDEHSIFLPKPFSPGDLLRRVDEILDA